MNNTNETMTRKAAKAIIDAYDEGKAVYLRGVTIAADAIRKGGDLKECLDYFIEERGHMYVNKDSLKTAVNKTKQCIQLLVAHPTPATIMYKAPKEGRMYDDESYDDWSQRQLLDAAKHAGVIRNTGKPSANTKKTKAIFEKRLAALVKEFRGVVTVKDIDAAIARIEEAME